MVVGFLGILKAGGAYAPLDPNYPPERLRYMLKDARPSVLLTQERLKATLPATAAQVISLDTGWSEIAGSDEGNLDPRSLGLTSRNLAYVIYTSGSTGEPKGAMIEHRGACNLARAQSLTFNVGRESRVLQFSSLSFDACVWEMLMALCGGARLQLAPRECLLPGAPLLDLASSGRQRNACRRSAG
jgi:non-ribosomal peptide synthetase component F